MLKPTMRNNTGCESGFCGACVGGTCFAFSQGARPVPIRISAPMMAIMIFGKPNSSMKVAAMPN